MTMITSQDEEFGRALVARTTFEKESVWLPVLAIHHLNAGEPVIRGKVFTDCLIEGPAVIAVLHGLVLDGCNLGSFTDPRSLTLKPRGEKIIGAIGIADCRFVRCRFVQVGFTGTDTFLDDLVGGLVDMSRTGDEA